MKSKIKFKKTKIASISGIFGSIAILKIFCLNLEQSIIVAVPGELSFTAPSENTHF
jgi:hypothetical protein